MEVPYPHPCKRSCRNGGGHSSLLLFILEMLSSLSSTGTGSDHVPIPENGMRRMEAAISLSSQGRVVEMKVTFPLSPPSSPSSPSSSSSLIGIRKCISLHLKLAMRVAMSHSLKEEYGDGHLQIP